MNLLSAKGLENIAIRQEACQSTTTLSSRAANTNQQSISPRCFDHPRYTGEVLQHVEETSWKKAVSWMPRSVKKHTSSGTHHDTVPRWDSASNPLNLQCFATIIGWKFGFRDCINKGPPWTSLGVSNHKAQNCQGTHKVHLFGRHQIVLFQVGLDLPMEGK